MSGSETDPEWLDRAAVPENDSAGAPTTAKSQGDDLVAELNTRIRQELLAARRGGLVRVKDVHDGGAAVTVALKQAPETIYTRIPVLVPYAAPVGGDSLPLVPGETEGLVVFIHDPVADLLATRGPREDRRFDRTLASQKPLFLPAQVPYRDEAPASTAADERVLGHPSGSQIRMKPNGDIRLEHAEGHAVEVSSSGVTHETPETE